MLLVLYLQVYFQNQMLFYFSTNCTYIYSYNFGRNIISENTVERNKATFTLPNTPLKT